MYNIIKTSGSKREIIGTCSTAFEYNSMVLADISKDNAVIIISNQAFIADEEKVFSKTVYVPGEELALDFSLVPDFNVIRYFYTIMYGAEERTNEMQD